MEKALTIILVLMAAAAQAGELKITETATCVTVEYTGTPEKGGTAEKVPIAPVATQTTKIEYRAAQIDHLKKELEELEKLTGTETEKEVAAKNALAEDLKQKIETYTIELRQIAAPTQSAAGNNAAPTTVISPPPAVTVTRPTGDGTPPRAETVAEQRNRRVALRSDVRERKQALIRSIMTSNE